jgi:hypothetical protein
MALTSSAEKKIERAFHIDGRTCETIWDIIAKAGGDLAVEYVCADGRTHQGTHLDDLLRYQNARSRQIRSIKFNNGYHDIIKERKEEVRKARVEVRIDDTPEIYYFVEGETPIVIFISDQLESILESTYLRYPVFYFANIRLSFPTVLIVAISWVPLFIALANLRIFQSVVTRVAYAIFFSGLGHICVGHCRPDSTILRTSLSKGYLCNR